MPALEERGARGIVTEGRGFTPLVSIGLPVYNGARFIAQALDALLGQTLHDFELIISDNASTDGTDICLDYAARDARFATSPGVQHRRGAQLEFCRARGPRTLLQMGIGE
jgi:glycosyltransferase involved in cell wall biosynthesis